MTLSQARRAFTRQIALFLVWATDHGYELALDEGRVITPRKVWVNGQVKPGYVDGMHMPGSVHYLGLGVDLNLYRGDEYVDDGGDPVWTLLGTKWQEMGKAAGLPLRAGVFFSSVDSNHFSLQWGKVA